MLIQLAVTAVTPPCLSRSHSALQDGTVDLRLQGSWLCYLYKHIDNPTIYELKQGWRTQRVNHKLCKQLYWQEQCIVVQHANAVMFMQMGFGSLCCKKCLGLVYRINSSINCQGYQEHLYIILKSQTTLRDYWTHTVKVTIRRTIINVFPYIIKVVHVTSVG